MWLTIAKWFGAHKLLAALIGAGVLLAAGVAAWIWIGGLYGTIEDQKDALSDKDREIGALNEALQHAAGIANHNAAELAAEQSRAQGLPDRLAQRERDHQRRESRLEEALREIDKWTPEMDGDIGPGLRGTLNRLRRQAGAGAAGGDPGAGDLRPGP